MVKKGPQLCSGVAQRLNVPQGYASAFRSLRPRWMAFLNIRHTSCRSATDPNATVGMVLETFLEIASVGVSGV